MMRVPQAVVVIAAGLWGAALGFSTLSARVLYGDGARFVHLNLLTPHRFNDYDSQRTFASLISQAPVLFGQRFGLDSVAAYAALYSVGVFVIPAALMMTALFFARRQPALFAANGLALVVYGFSANFINTEANMLFGLVWLSVTILGVQGKAPHLRGIVLPVLAFAMVRAYEGMLLIGPILAVWAFLAAAREEGHVERVGLMIATLLFCLGATIGLGGFLSPRDPANASTFLSSALAYLRNPHIFLLLSGLAATAGICLPGSRVRVATAVAAGILGVVYVVAIVRLEGFYSFSAYYQNRSFLVLSLPAFVGSLLVVYWWKPALLGPGIQDWRYGLLLIPLGFAVAADVAGTYRWNSYVQAFCEVLEKPISPIDRLRLLKASGSQTAWAWTHPTMSVLLRDRGGTAMVVNEPGAFTWQPFDPAHPPTITHRGLCQAPLLGAVRPDSFDLPLNFTQRPFPSYITSVTGLSKTENWATWSEGPTVEFRFARPLPPSFDLSLRIGAVFGGNKGAPIKVRAGSQELEFTVDREPADVTILFRQVGDADTLLFRIPNPESPRQLGTGEDARMLGIAFVSMKVVPR